MPPGFQFFTIASGPQAARRVEAQGGFQFFTIASRAPTPFGGGGRCGSFQFFTIASAYASGYDYYFGYRLSILYDCFKTISLSTLPVLRICFQFFTIASLPCHRRRCRPVSPGLSILYDCFDIVHDPEPAESVVTFQFFTIASTSVCSMPSSYDVDFQFFTIASLRKLSMIELLGYHFQFFTIASVDIDVPVCSSRYDLSILYDCFRSYLPRRSPSRRALLSILYDCFQHTCLQLYRRLISRSFNSLRLLLCWERACEAHGDTPTFNSLRLLRVRYNTSIRKN